MTNSVANGFSLRRSLEDQGVTEEDSIRGHLQQADIMVDIGLISSFSHYRVPLKSDPNNLMAPCFSRMCVEHYHA